jgi:hypothetical protein
MPKPKRPLTLGGRVVDGVLHLDSRNLFDAALKHADWQRRVVVTIQPEEQKRSSRANAFLWAVVYGQVIVPALRDAGYRDMTAERVHELMKDRHLSEVVISPLTGEEKRVPRSTTTLTPEEFGEFLERTMCDFAELLGCSFPEPRKHEDWRQAA